MPASQVNLTATTASVTLLIVVVAVVVLTRVNLCRLQDPTCAPEGCFV